MVFALAVSNYLPASRVASDEPTVAYATGQKAPAFVVKTTDGKTVKFPGDALLKDGPLHDTVTIRRPGATRPSHPARSRRPL
jgi:hypothetical protein